MKRLPVLIILLAVTTATFAFDFSSLDAEKVLSGSSKLIKAAAGISDEDEIKIGRDVAANLAARYRPLEEEERLRYVNLVGQTVARRSSRSDIPYHFGMVRTDEINAWAAPGGYIIVTEGLLKFLKDESELAGVLAHEISHVTQKHIMKAIRQANLLEAGSDFASAAGKNVDKYGQVTDFSINLLATGLSRKDELEADALGVALAAKAGYNPMGLRDVVKRLGEKNPKDSALAHFSKTHPSASERLRVVDKALAENHLADKGPRLADRYTSHFLKS